MVECLDSDDVLAVATEGHRHRHVGSHELNFDSSRSHSILTLTVENHPRQADADGEPGIYQMYLPPLVELAPLLSNSTV